MKIFPQMLELLPYPVITALIVVIWKYDYLALWFVLIYWWIVLPAILLSILFFILGLRWRNVWDRIVVVCFGANVLLLVVYLLVQAPNQRCNPKIMAKHYGKHHVEMEELHRYLGAAIDDSCAVTLEFDGQKQEMFHVSGAQDDYYSMHWNEESRELKDSLMAVVGMSQDEYDGIRKRLKKMGCIGIEYSQKTPEQITIWFRRVGMGKYDYIIYNRPMTDEEKEDSMEDMTLIPYSEICVFQYGGGAIGPQVFPAEDKEDFLAHHQPW